ncbi:hypothetical protein C5167_011722 [Papaver somniferum]|uniref:Uncharacterized protein n=1 Tax=Papaver somniferum TaxID=3469 RepID=A0A4Y7K538_PAPSO|nr:hypothetical protein C5167_011722 [Papaver somniferum]
MYLVNLQLGPDYVPDDCSSIEEAILSAYPVPEEFDDLRWKGTMVYGSAVLTRFKTGTELSRLGPV